MVKKHSLNVVSGRRYDNAGLLFRIVLELPEERNDDQGASVSISAEDLATGSRIPFTNDACPALADFMAGYPRWMVRLGIRSTREENEIKGTARAEATVEDLIDAVSQMGDMIDQRFSLYQESVLI